MSNFETGLAERRPENNRDMALERKSKRGILWKVVGGAIVAVVVAGVVANAHDIRRYIKISTM
jgi:Family of unknown function (DUF6893)